MKSLLSTLTAIAILVLTANFGGQAVADHPGESVAVWPTIDLKPVKLTFKRYHIAGIAVEMYGIKIKNVGNTVFGEAGKSRSIKVHLGYRLERTGRISGVVGPGSTTYISLGNTDGGTFRHCQRRNVVIDFDRTAGQSGRNVFRNDRQELLVYNV